MRHVDERLTMPLYVKSDPDMEWPEEHPSFYLLTGNGLFICRNHEFFQSCVPARSWPGELALQGKSLTLRYPRIPAGEMERIVGFFSRIGDLYGSEAAVLLLWDRERGRMTAHAPAQEAGVSEGWTGHRYPIDVRYEQPLDLPAHLTVVGSVHSHVEGAAYASSTDKQDEVHRAGLHVVVGRISREPPEFHCEVVVDGTRFEVEPGAVIDGYRSRSDAFPSEWIERVRVEVNRPYASEGWTSGAYDNGAGTDEPSIEYESYEDRRWS